jgi:glycosyltransferase involved in cell wall biosynthesis
MKYSLIIPVYNEEKTVNRLLKSLDKYSRIIEIIIINDGSNDKTKSLLEKQNSFKIIHNNKNRGKGFSITKGLELATKKNIILMDGDLEIHLNQIPELIKNFESNDKDVLVGMRWENNKHVFSNINSFGNYLINGIFNFLFNSNFNDVLCCVRILDKELFKSLKIKSLRFSIEAETLAKLVLKKVSIEQVLIHYKRRSVKEGKKLKLKDGWSIVIQIIKLRINPNNS